MRVGRRKYPRWLQGLIKVIIVLVALLIIFNRLESDSYQGIFSFSWHRRALLIPVFFTLWLLNLLLDARIWQRVHAMLGRINIFKALETNLVCYTLSFITPLNSGELAGRYIMLDQQFDRRKSFFLTFWSHFPRLIVKILLGITALLLLLKTANAAWLSILLLGMLICIIAYFSFIRLQKWLAGLGWRRILVGDYVLKNRPFFREKLRLLILAATKFLTYNLQFLVLLMLWGGVSFQPELLASVIAMYVIGAFIPTLPAADFVIKAGVAMLVFDTEAISESMLLNATLVTWLFNLAIPALIGGIIILKTDLMDAIKKQPLPGNPYDL